MKLRFLSLITLTAGVATFTSCKSDRRSSDTGDGIQTISVAQPEVKTVLIYNEYPGYLSANQSIDVVGKVDGEILTQNYESGKMVKEGQMLFRVDPSIYRDRMTEAEATLATAQSNAEYARVHYEAVMKALESDAVSKMEVAQAKSAYEAAQASIRNATAALETARRYLSYCTVTAPISGIASDDVVGAGSYITGEDSPVKLTTIYDNTSMTANFAIEDESYLSLINLRESGDTIDFDRIPVKFSEDLPHSYTGRLSYMAPDLKQSTGTMKIECKIENPYDELRSGMFVKVFLPIAKVENAVLVNNASIGSDQLGNYLYVVNDSNRVVYTPINAGQLYNDSLRIVTSGIKPGDRYVTKALLKVKNGMTVNPVLEK